MKKVVLKNLDLSELRNLHERIFSEWISTEKELEKIKKKTINSYKESVQREWDLKLLFDKSIELHKYLVNIDSEFQLRIWEGKID